MQLNFYRKQNLNMRKKIVAIAAFLISTLNIFSQDFNFKFCLSQKDATKIAFELTVCNNSSASLNPFKFVFNWPGVSNVTVDNGMDVIQNGNGGVVELQKQSWAQPLNPGCNNKFTIRMNYEFGMFPPTFGLLNGDTIRGITCYVPPSFENYKCKKDFNPNCFINLHKEIQIGEGTVRAWNSTRDVYVPANRKNWPIGMAVAHAIFTNLMGFDCLTANEYFATAMQESSCGCDPGVTAPAWVTNPYNIQPTNYCADLTHGVAAGFFQEEYGTGWIELEKDIPCFIPTVSFDQFIIGSKFETQAIGKAYHDFNNISYWQYIKCWNPIGFIKNSKDPYVTEKLIALGYNRGMNSGEIGNILTTNRAAAINATNILPYLNPGGVGWVYAEQISRITAVLDNNMGAIDPADPATSSVPYPGVHSFRSFYDAQISWADMSSYLDVITPMYAGVGVNAASFKSKIQKVFNSIKSGADLSFRYELAPVIDAIALNLPAFDPKFGLGGMYVNSGGSSCKYPTAALSKSDTVCMGSPLVLTVKLTGTAPWSFSYQNPKGAVVTLNNITTSPYTFTVPDTGVYHLTAVTDGTGTQGDAICEPVIKAYIKNGGLADLISISAVPCGPQSIQIKFTGTGPFDIEYKINGTLQTPINGITQNPFTIIPPAAPVGVYVLTRLKANGCDLNMADTVTIYPLTTPKLTIDGNVPICKGDSVKLTVQSTSVLKTYKWLPATGLSSTNTGSVKASPAVKTTYTLTVTDANGCTAIDSVTVIVNSKAKIILSADTSICPDTKTTLNASGAVSYSWAPATGLNGTSTASVIASPAVTTTYTLTTKDNNGCINKDSVKLSILTKPKITVSADTIICLNAKATLKATGGATYSWTPATGLNVATGATVIASPSASTEYIVTGTALNGCSAIDTVKVGVIPCGFTATVLEGNVCKGECFTLIAVPAGGTPPYQYSWLPGNLTGDSISVCPLTNTTYSVTITDHAGNSTQANGTVSIVPCNFKTTVKGGSICAGDCFTLTATSSGGTPPYTFTWQPGNITADSIKVCPADNTVYKVSVTDKDGNTGQGTGVVKVGAKPQLQVSSKSICKDDTTTLLASGAATYAWSSGQTTPGITVKPVVSTSYTVTGASLDGCLDTAIATVSVKSKPLVEFSPDTIACAPLVVYFKNLSTGLLPNATCTWDFGNGIKSKSCIPKEIKYETPGTYTISLTVDNEGCSSSISRQAITVYPVPTAAFTADPLSTDLYNPVITFTNASANSTKNTWIFGDGTSDSSDVTVKHTYAEPGIYQVCLKVSSGNNCQDEYCSEVIIHPGWSFYIPNAFTPDSDGLNTVFNGKGENISEYKLLIFNRWGNLIFESNSLSDGWDGKANNGLEIAQQEVYVYKVSFRDVLNKKHEYIGSVTLIK